MPVWISTTGSYIVTSIAICKMSRKELKIMFARIKGKTLFLPAEYNVRMISPKLGSKIFNNLLGYLTETQQDSSSCQFGTKKSAVDAMAQLKLSQILSNDQ
ncbi:MAG: hypothetical protein IPH28_23120 [Cytophagaceae bacterium]|nr:hypothetical protein [Cytophagaceae bacterium]